MTFTKEQLTRIIESADEVITALAGTNDDIHPDNSTKMCAAWDDLNDRNAPPSVVKRLAELALAGMEAEPVASPFGYLRVVSGRSFQIMEGSTRPPDRSGDCAGPWFPIWTSAPAPQPLTTSERAELENYRNAQQVVHVDADDNFYSWFGREWHEHYQHNQYTTAAKQMLGVMADSAWKAGHRAAMLQAGNSPVIPDGCCIMPMKLTAENGAKGALSGEFHVTHHIVCQSCGGEGCEDCNEEGGWDGEILIGWDIIKQIHDAAVKACSLPAAPQQEV